MLAVALARPRAAADVADLVPPGEVARVASLPAPGRDRRATASALLALVLRHLGLPVVPLARRCGTCGGAHGQPRHPAAGVGVSTCGALVAAAVALGGEVGVDVEAAGAAGLPGLAVVPGLAGVVLAPGEASADLTRTWVRKEALLKAAGTGLARDPRTVRLDDGAGAPRVLAGPAAQLWDVPSPDGTVCALALLGEARPALALLDGDALLDGALLDGALLDGGLSPAAGAAAPGPATAPAAPPSRAAARPRPASPAW